VGEKRPRPASAGVGGSVRLEPKPKLKRIEKHRDSAAPACISTREYLFQQG